MTSALPHHDPNDGADPLAPRDCAGLLLRYLSGLGVPWVFGVPGGNIDPFLDTLQRNQDASGVRWVLARSEAGAGFMADGYARASGRLGVCSATSGPGCTNLLTPVSNAYVDGIPLLVLTGQNAVRTFGRGAMQEVSASGADVMLMFRGCTRYNALITHPEQLEHALLSALAHATGPTPGPVHLAIPQDLFTAPLPPGRAPFSRNAFAGQEFTPDRVLLHRLETLLRGARRGVVVIGAGCTGAMDQVLCWAEHRGWPIVATPMGRGLVPTDHPLFRGVFGTAGHDSARRALASGAADLVLAVGANLDEHATCGWDGSTILSERLVQVNQNPEHLARSHMARLNLLGSPRIVFRHLNRGHAPLPQEPRGQPHAMPLHRDTDGLPRDIELLHRAQLLQDGEPINPRRLFWALGQGVPPGTCLFADAGNAFFWAPHYWHPPGVRVVERNRLQLSMGFAAMGWAIGAAIGAKLADPALPVLCITGDGSYLMSAQEIGVARQLGLNVVFLVLNNGVLGTVQHGQRMRGLADTGNRLPETDFAMMARAMGVESYRIGALAELRELDLPRLFRREGPVLLDVRVDPEVAPPIGERVRTLDQARTAQP